MKKGKGSRKDRSIRMIKNENFIPSSSNAAEKDQSYENKEAIGRNNFLLKPMKEMIENIFGAYTIFIKP